MISRRSLIRGMGALLAAPAIVRAATLMPVRSVVAGSRLEQMEALAALSELYRPYIIPAAMVQQLGCGSILAGQRLLDGMVQQMRRA
jgi:hypothetical protein